MPASLSIMQYLPNTFNEIRIWFVSLELKVAQLFGLVLIYEVSFCSYFQLESFESMFLGFVEGCGSVL